MTAPLRDPAVRNAVVVLGAVAAVVGLGGLVAASGEPPTAAQGAHVRNLLHLNLVGAGVTVALAAVTLAGGVLRSRPVVLVAAIGWLLCAAQVALQTGTDPNPLGGTASTMGAFTGIGAALLAIALTRDEAPS